MFNVFNHARFYPNGSVDRNIGNAPSGQVLRTADPRIGQNSSKVASEDQEKMQLHLPYPLENRKGRMT